MEYLHTKLNLRLVLRVDVDNITQGDMERLLAEMRKSKLGDSQPEYEGKLLRAAVAAGWVEEPKPTADEIAKLNPRHVRWYASKIDAVYTEARLVPPE